MFGIQNHTKIWFLIASFFFSQITAYAETQTTVASPVTGNPMPAVSATDASMNEAAQTNETPSGAASLNNEESPLSPPTTGSSQAAISAENVSTLPGRPILTTFSNQADVTVAQSSSSQFRFDYDISTPDSFGGAIINFGESPAGAQNLTTLPQIEFEIATNNACPEGTPCLKIEFVDVNNQMAVLNVDALSTTASSVAVTQEELDNLNPSLDRTAIKQINFVVDQALTSLDEGFFEIGIGGLAFEASVSGEAPSAAPTQFPGSPAITTFSNESTATVENVSDAVFRLNYDVTAAGSFGGAIINYGEAGGPQNLSSISEFVFNIDTNNTCGINDKCLKVEFVDVNNELAAVTVRGIGSSAEQITIPQTLLSEVNANLDFTQIKQINIVIEEANTSPKAGFIEVTTGGFGGTNPGPGPGPALTVAATDPTGTPTQFPGETPPITTFSNQSTATVEQTSDAQFRLNYDVTTAGSFGGAIINYGEGAAGFQNLSSISEFIFHLATDNTCAGAKCLKIEFVDADNELAAVDVTGLASTDKEVRISQTLLTSANASLDMTRIKQINFVVEETNTTPKAGSVNVTTGGFGGTDPGPGPGPGPEPEPTDGVFTGISENETVTGVVTFQPNLTENPDIRKVLYYLDGTKAGRSYSPPFAWGAAEGIDTSMLANGEHTLTALYTTDEGDQEFSVTFTVSNATSTPPSIEPEAAPEGAFTGLEANETVDGAITVRPDLSVAPNIHKVFYYIDGGRVDRLYSEPFELNFDISNLSEGPHTLSILYGTTDGDFMNSGEFTVDIPFTIGTSDAPTPSTGSDGLGEGDPALGPAGPSSNPTDPTLDPTDPTLNPPATNPRPDNLGTDSAVDEMINDETPGPTAISPPAQTATTVA